MDAERKAVPWGRLVGEGVTIILGILIALGADAWWDERQERAEEQVLLRQLSAEFTDNAVQLDSVLAIHRRGLEAATVLLGVGRGEVQIGSDSLRSLILTSDSPWTFNPKQGALGSIIASGRLGIIRDDSLRVALAGWPGVLDDFTEDEWNYGEFTRGPQYEYLSSVLNWSDIYAPREGGPTQSLQHLIGDARLASIMAYGGSWLETIRDESHLVTVTSDRILEMLRHAIAF